MKYKIEFITNCVGLVPYKVWSKAKNIDDIDKNATSGHTLFFLCTSGYDGFPVGIQKDKQNGDSLLLNNGNYTTFEELTNEFGKNQISTGIN